MEENMLPCLSKKIFGIDCLGCGAQRATAFLFKGEFLAAFKMYPGIYPLLFLVLFLVFDLFVKTKYAKFIKIILGVTTVLTIVISYFIKIATH